MINLPKLEEFLIFKLKTQYSVFHIALWFCFFVILCLTWSAQITFHIHDQFFTSSTFLSH